MNRTVSILAAFILMLMSINIVLAEGEDVKIFYNGEKIECDVEPFIENGRTLVPARAVFEKMGAKVEWIEEDNLVVVEKDDYTVELTISSDVMYKTTFNDDITVDELTLDVPAKIVSDRTFIPLRAVSEALDCAVLWKDNERAVYISAAASDTSSPTKEPIVSDAFEDKLSEQMPKDKNYMVSPLSLKIALAMLANGAEEESKAEMMSLLDINDLDEFNEYIKSFISDYNGKNNTEDEDGGYHTEFTMANSIWLNRSIVGDSAEFSKEYSDIITNYYDGDSAFVTTADAAQRINVWVSDKTNEKIKSIADNGDFAAALVNAVYMKANWVDEFYDDGKQSFTDRNGKATEIDFMSQTDRFTHYSDSDVELIRLPYYDGISMYVSLGDITPTELKYYMDKMSSHKVHIEMPKWKTESTFDMTDMLKAMGIKSAFLNPADFRNMLINTNEEIILDKVLQKTYIDVDEKGTEAAAVTAIFMGTTSAVEIPEKIYEFRADKPFNYFITDNQTGEIIFMGEYAYAE